MRRDVVVLGAGIVGLATALKLQEKGRSVAIVDRQGAGEGTSFGNAGLIERASIYPYAFPRRLGDLVKYGLNNTPEAHYHASYLPRIAPWLARCPTSPAAPIAVAGTADRPQPRRDRDAGAGMTVTVGRVREDPLLDVRLVAMGHNTVRGAAGGSVLNAELLALGAPPCDGPVGPFRR